MKKRIISAIVMLIIFIPLLIIGKTPFAIFILTLGMIALYELLKLKPKLPLIVKILTFLYTAIIISYASRSYIIDLALDIKYLIVPILVFLSLLVFINKPKIYNYHDAFHLIGISLFIGIAFGNIIRIRNLDIYILIYLFLISILTDTFAYLVGSFFGKHKLAKNISPNKTIEGLVGGTLIGTVGAVIFYLFLVGTDKNIFLLILLTLILSLICSLGDLVTSSIKRNENIKDFSNLIPGHGGVLDRLDSIIFVAITYILISNLY